MAIFAYQVSGFAYQGSGQFAYQGSDDAVQLERFSGGWEYARRARRRTEEDLLASRRLFGVLPKAAEVIARVAIRQADDLSSDDQKRLDELERELKARGIEYESRYLEVLNIQRERLIDAEIKGFYEGQLQADNERAILALLIALV